jgi:hypothetical protein
MGAGQSNDAFYNLKLIVPDAWKIGANFRERESGISKW